MKSVEIVFPVYFGNYDVIEKSISKTEEYCSRFLTKYQWKLIISINGPFPEKIISLCKRIMKKSTRVNYVYTPTPGKGAGLKNAWLLSSADYLAYMDIDLSVDITSLPALFSELEHSDIVVGSRYHKESFVNRTLKRKFISIFYHKLFQGFFLGSHYDDAHCGFKAIKREVAHLILYHVQDPGWFFDTEFMYLSEKLGYKIISIPIKWRGGINTSGVNMKRVIPGFILKVLELKLRVLPSYIHKKRSQTK